MPLDEAQPEERLLFLLNDSKAPILITKSTVNSKFSQYKGTQILLDNEEEQINQRATENLELSLSKAHLAYIIYTSGSTGTPKGVLIEHGSVLNYCQWFAEYTQCQAQQRIDFSSNPIFDMAVSVSIIPLMLGLTSVICADEIKKNSRHYLQHLADARINIMKLTPSYFKILLQEAKNKRIALPQLHSLILGGENLAAAECQSWLSIYPEHILFNEYGPTEATVAVLVHQVTAGNYAHLEANVPIGCSGMNMSCIILDEEQLPVHDGDSGELYIGGICLARGYLNQPQLTEQKFIKDPFSTEPNARLYKTGDLCKKHADGPIEYLGRMDDQVKIRGFRIEPGEVEKHLTAHPEIKTAAVVAQKDRLNEQRLVAYYILKKSDSAPSSNEIREYLQHKVPEYMLPTAFIKVEALPLTANGKLDKAALPIPLLETNQHYVGPKTALEKKLTKMWSDELGVALLGMHDNFFELGGHSLSAARLVSKINHELKRNITLFDFYQAACIAALVPVIKRTKKVKKEKTAMKKQDYMKLTTTPLSDFQFLLWMSNTFEPKAKKLNIVARKRMQGRLNTLALEFAFQSVLKKHEVLIYRILKFKPTQKVQKNTSFQLIECSLDALSKHESEKALDDSMQQLINFHHWPKDSPLIMAKLFHLQEDSAELQICMPHLISDDASIDILFADLSKFYLLYNNQLNLDEIKTDTHYKEYVFTERHSLEISLDKNSAFWEEYLKDTTLFTFPEHYIVHDMSAAKTPYSTYAELSKQAVNNLKFFCEQNHISINNGLCAVLALALRNCSENYHCETPYTLMNIVKSTRENPVYDHSIGCFLRVEPVKVALNDSSTLFALSKQVRQSTMDTSNYQQCSNLIKLSSVSNFNKKRKMIQSFFIELLTPIYTKILQIPPIYRKILQRCGGRLISFKRDNHFLINLNVRSNFITDTSKKSNLFGLETEIIKSHQEDLLAIDYIFEACFFYDDSQRAYYLVVSANLQPDFRELITKEIIHIMDSALFENANGAHEPQQPIKQIT